MYNFINLAVPMMGVFKYFNKIITLCSLFIVGTNSCRTETDIGYFKS